VADDGTTADPVAARLGYHRACMEAAIAQPEALDLPVLLGDWGKALDVLGILLDAHTPLTLYASAEDCGHPGPPETGAGGYTPWDEWHDNHPRGSGPADLVSGERVCLLTPAGSACPACSALVYADHDDEDDFVSATDCIVLPVIGKALSEEITDD